MAPLSEADLTSEGLFSEFETYVRSLGESDSVLSQLEAFKKMVFKMLDGKKKSVEVGDGDDVEEGVGYKVKSPSNTGGRPRKSKAKWVNYKMPGNDRNPDKTYDLSTPTNKQSHRPVDPGAVKRITKGKANMARKGKGTKTARMKAENLRNLATALGEASISGGMFGLKNPKKGKNTYTIFTLKGKKIIGGMNDYSIINLLGNPLKDGKTVKVRHDRTNKEITIDPSYLKKSNALIKALWKLR